MTLFLAQYFLATLFAANVVDISPATPDVVAHWTFDGISPTTAIDSSAGGFDGTIFGAQRVPGLRGGALRFDGPEVDGIADRVIVADALGLNVSGAITIEAIFMSLGEQPRGFIPLVAKNVPGATGSGYALWITGGAESNRASTYMVTPDFSVGVWHHVVFQHDGSIARFYIDGELVAERLSPPDIVRQAAQSSRFVEIGGSENRSPAPGRGTFNGIIDEIRVSGGILEPSQFLRLNAAPVALCSPRVLAADSQCTAWSSVDDGSYDPEGDELVLSQNPEGPYPVGVTEVILTAVDPGGAVASCEASVEVVDLASPMVECNVPFSISPNEAPIEFRATAADNCSIEQVWINEIDCFKFTKNGKRIDKTASCSVVEDSDLLTVLDAGGVGTTITWIAGAVDAAGNQIRRHCEVEVVNPNAD